MAVGLYSEIARAGIVEARSFIAERGYGSSADDIRRCRQDLIAHDGGKAFPDVYASSDFYSTSDCRDLLFHVQEHRLTIPQIAAFLADNALDFIGFELEAGVASQYRSDESRRPGNDGSGVLGCIRAPASRHVFRHVPVLGAEARMRAGYSLGRPGMPARST